MAARKGVRTSRTTAAHLSRHSTSHPHPMGPASPGSCQFPARSNSAQHWAASLCAVLCMATPAAETQFKCWLPRCLLTPSVPLGWRPWVDRLLRLQCSVQNLSREQGVTVHLAALQPESHQQALHKAFGDRTQPSFPHRRQCCGSTSLTATGMGSVTVGRARYE